MILFTTVLEVYITYFSKVRLRSLPHRLKSGPFQREEMGMEDLQERIEQLQGGSSSENQQEGPAELAEEERPGSKKA